jgi:2-dehydro-3-deoxyphosphooctonate aldolase (KDO 8-P synthase)
MNGVAMGAKKGDIFRHRSSANQRLFVIAGPCVVESEPLCLQIGRELASLAEAHQVDIVYKASYDKANRTSSSSFRGIGMREGLAVLRKVKQETGLPVLTDVHTPAEAEAAAEMADVLQIPAFLCRQTDLIQKAAQTGKLVNIKKGQFMAPDDMAFAVEKAGSRCWLTERGTFFGYHRLVVDFAALPALKVLGKPVVFDATHSVQTPGGLKGASGGDREVALLLARAALAAGFDGLFMEVHPEPDKAMCDGPNSVALSTFAENLPGFIDLHERARHSAGA